MEEYIGAPYSIDTQDEEVCLKNNWDVDVFELIFSELEKLALENVFIQYFFLLANSCFNFYRMMFNLKIWIHS